eukprot:jgi/Galph1/1846/GphlegSOOS_G548.1
MSHNERSISVADLSIYESNINDTFECIIHPVKLVDFSVDLHGFALLEEFVKDDRSLIVTNFSGEDTQEIILKLLRLLEETNYISDDIRIEAKIKLLGAKDTCSGRSQALGYWTQSIQGPSFIVGYTDLEKMKPGHLVTCLVRLAHPINLDSLNGSLTQYIGLTLTGRNDSFVHSSPEIAKSLASVLADLEFREDANQVCTDDDLRTAIRLFIERQKVQREQRECSALQPLTRQVQFEDDDPTLKQTIGVMNEKIYGVTSDYYTNYHMPSYQYWISLMFLHPFVLILADLKRRLPYYLSDFLFEMNQKRALQKYFSTTIFLMFTATLPAIVFGYIVDRTTDGQIGVIESLFAQGVLGMGFSIFSGQPLMVNMITGPTVVYIQVLMRWSEKLGFDFLPFYAWTGIWMGIFLILSAILNTAVLIPFLGRFTDEIFQTFIGIIFIQYWFTEFVRVAHDGYTQVLLFLFLSMLTVGMAIVLSSLRSSYLLVPWIRTLFGDVGPSFAVLIVSGISYAFDPIFVKRLQSYWLWNNTGRPWVIPLGNLQVGYIFLAAVTGFLLFLVVFIDQNVCTYIVERPENRLRKGTAYSWNMVVVGGLNIVASILGIPWMYAGLPHSLLHVYALADVEEHEYMGRRVSRIIHAREVRFTGGITYMFTFLILLAKPALDQLPIDVLYGFILFMGVASFRSNGLVDRLILLITQPEKYPPSHIIRRVQRFHIHLYTIIQLFMVITLFFVAVNFYRGSTMFNTGLIFPFVLFLFIPFKHIFLYHMFPKQGILALESGNV